MQVFHSVEKGDVGTAVKKVQAGEVGTGGKALLLRSLFNSF